MKFEVELGVPPLPLSAARKLALGLCPEAGDDLVKAGRRLAGEMCFLAAYADLGRPSQTPSQILFAQPNSQTKKYSPLSTVLTRFLSAVCVLCVYSDDVI